MRWSLCRQTHARLRKIVGALGFTHVDPSRIFCVRGYGSTSEAWARIWGLPTLWQQVLGIRPAYVVEIIEPEFSHLPRAEQDRVLIHELLHIPRTTGRRSSDSTSDTWPEAGVPGRGPRQGSGSVAPDPLGSPSRNERAYRAAYAVV